MSRTMAYGDSQRDMGSAKTTRLRPKAASLDPRVTSRGWGLQDRYGNRALEAALRDREVVQRKTCRETASDVCERQADAVSHAVVTSSPLRCQRASEANAASTILANPAKPDIGARTGARRSECALGGGTSMAPSMRDFFESRIGHDFSNVRLHTGTQGAYLAQSYEAEALTIGSDIYFAQGAFQPNTDAGKKLLAHELTHVVQQRYGTTRVQRQPQRQFSGTPCYPTSRMPGELSYPGTLEHLLIQQHYISNVNPRGETEYLIPGSGPNGGTGYADIVDPISGEIFEVKFFGVAANAITEVERYVAAAIAQCDSTVPWHRGLFYPNAVLPYVGDQEVVSWLYAPGVIAYYVRRRRRDEEEREQQDQDHTPFVFDWTQDASRSTEQSTHETTQPEDKTAENTAKAAFITLMLAAAAKYGRPWVVQALRQAATSLAPPALAFAEAGGVTIFGSGSGTAAAIGSGASGSGGAAATGAQAGRLLILGTRAGIIGAAAAVSILIFYTVANYTYQKIYEGTRGWKILACYKRIGQFAERLGHEFGEATNVLGLLLDAKDPDTKDWEGVRNYLFDVLYQVRKTLYETATELNASSRSFSAISDELERGNTFSLELSTTIADDLISSGSRTFSDLSLLHIEIENMVTFIEGQIAALVDNHQRVLSADVKNWLARKR